MRNGLVLFTSDRGIRPADLAVAAEERGFDTFYVPEHTHIPVRRTAAHPGTKDETLPDDRYLRTLDPWVSLATVAARTSTIKLSTAVALPVESDPITLAKTIATLDHLSDGRVEIGAGFGWNTDELADHHVPAEKRRTVLKEYVEAMRALWTQEEASYDGEFVRFGPSWAYPKPSHHIPLIIGAGGGPKTFQWISEHADGWMTTPTQQDISGQVENLKAAWAEAGREGLPDIRVLIAFRPDPDDIVRWHEQGVSELIWGVPDKAPDEVISSLDRMADRLGLQPPALIG